MLVKRESVLKAVISNAGYNVYLYKYFRKYENPCFSRIFGQSSETRYRELHHRHAPIRIGNCAALGSRHHRPARVGSARPGCIRPDATFRVHLPSDLSTCQCDARLNMAAVSMTKPRKRDATGKKSTQRVMNRRKWDARSCSSTIRPGGDRFSDCQLSKSVVHKSCASHTALRGSSWHGAALGSN